MKDSEIFEILDGEASEALIHRHEVLLKTSEAYTLQFKEMSYFHSLMNDLPIERTSDDFTKNLMAQLAFKPVAIHKRSYKLPIYFSIIMASLMGLMAWFLSNVEASIPQKTIVSLPKFNFSWLSNPMTIQICVIVNVLILLVLFDKAVLKPYFVKRYEV